MSFLHFSPTCLPFQCFSKVHSAGEPLLEALKWSKHQLHGVAFPPIIRHQEHPHVLCGVMR